MNQKYTIACSGGHTLKVGASELEEILEFKLCPNCEKDIIDVDPTEIDIACAMCGWQEFTYWDEVSGWFIDYCPNCSRHGFKQSLHIVGSFHYQTDLYLNMIDYVDVKNYERGQRPDYWEIVTHFCERSELIEIMDLGIIKASATGYFRVPAVCLTEVPIPYSKEIRDVHGDYGIVFRKRIILENGGQPVIHMTDNLIQSQIKTGFSSETKPFVQLIRIPSIAGNKRSKRVDFLHEREWRVAGDIDLNQVVPIGIVLPEGSKYEKFSGTKWDDLLKAVYHYGEIRVDSN